MSDPVTTPAPPPARRENWFAALLLCAAVAWFGWAVTRAWDNGNLPGCEFRQAQTAVSAYWIQKDRDFSLAYPTPVLGKPWSIPMEFPLYQWTVVAVSDLTSTPLVQSARAVSLGCFLAALPALWILLRRFGLPPARRALLLALVLTCPLLIFYARSFLIETMALMWALWFVAAFVEAMHTRRFGWLLLANLAGAAAGTVKVTTFILYLIPSAVWGAWLLRQAWRERPESVRSVFGVLARGLGCVIVPIIATVAWTRHADAVKALNPSGAFLASDNMAGFNFGLGSFNLRFSGEAWLAMFNFWSHGILSAPVAAVAALAAAMLGGRWRRPALACLGLFFLAQLIFPLLYTWHEYYFVANAALLVLVAGFALCSLLEHPRTHLLGCAVTVALFAAQSHLFTTTYHRPHLSYPSHGGGAVTDILNTITYPNEVLVVAGEDWDSSTPFFAQRRALMLRRNTESDTAMRDRAFANLKREPVAALVLSGDQRDNHALIAAAVARLGVAPDPSFETATTTVRLHRDLAATFNTDIRRENYPGVTWHAQPAAPTASGSLHDRIVETATLRGRDRLLFSMMKPAPVRFYSRFGAGTSPLDGARIFNANPDTRLWFRNPRGGGIGRARVGLMPGAYANPQAASDGVEFRVSAVSTNGSDLRPLYSRVVAPLVDPADRGTIDLEFPLNAGVGVTILVEILPGPAGNDAFDWFYIAELRLGCP